MLSTEAISRWVVLLSLFAGSFACAAEQGENEKARNGLETRKVAFPTEDNLSVAAGYTPPHVKAGEKAPVAILLHMYNSDRTAFNPLLPALHVAGFAILAIDLRGHGESVGPPHMGLAKRVTARDKKLFAEMYQDVGGGYRWLATQPDVDLSRFVLVGASVGCSIALDYAARDRSVDGVVCLTPGTAYMGIDSIADARKYGPRPLLLLAAAAERKAAEELGKFVPESTVKIVPGPNGDPQALHGTRMFGKVPDIERTIADFLLKASGPPPQDTVVSSIKGKVYYPSDSNHANTLSQSNVRWFSSPAEAEKRGLRPARTGSGKSRGKQGAAKAGEPFPENPK